MTDHPIRITIDYSDRDACYLATCKVGDYPGHQVYMEHGQTQIEALNNIAYAMAEVLKADEAELVGLNPEEPVDFETPFSMGGA